MRGDNEPPVDGLSAPPAAGSEKPRPRLPDIGGDDDGLLDTAAVFILSNDNLEKIASSVSWRGSRTASRNTIKAMRRTSNSSPSPGIRFDVLLVIVAHPELLGLSSSNEDDCFRVIGGGMSAGTKAPQNSWASLALIMLPWPRNSRSSGKKTA